MNPSSNEFYPQLTRTEPGTFFPVTPTVVEAVQCLALDISQWAREGPAHVHARETRDDALPRGFAFISKETSRSDAAKLRARLAAFERVNVWEASLALSIPLDEVISRIASLYDLVPPQLRDASVDSSGVRETNIADSVRIARVVKAT